MGATPRPGLRGGAWPGLSTLGILPRPLPSSAPIFPPILARLFGPGDAQLSREVLLRARVAAGQPTPPLPALALALALRSPSRLLPALPGPARPRGPAGPSRGGPGPRAGRSCWRKPRSVRPHRPRARGAAGALRSGEAAVAGSRLRAPTGTPRPAPARSPSQSQPPPFAPRPGTTRPGGAPTSLSGTHRGSSRPNGLPRARCSGTIRSPLGERTSCLASRRAPTSEAMTPPQPAAVPPTALPRPTASAANRGARLGAAANRLSPRPARGRPPIGAEETRGSPASLRAAAASDRPLRPDASTGSVLIGSPRVGARCSSGVASGSGPGVAARALAARPRVVDPSALRAPGPRFGRSLRPRDRRPGLLPRC